MGITISPWMMAFLMLMTGFAGFVDSAAGGGGLISLPICLPGCRPTTPMPPTSSALPAARPLPRQAFSKAVP